MKRDAFNLRGALDALLSYIPFTDEGFSCFNFHIPTQNQK